MRLSSSQNKYNMTKEDNIFFAKNSSVACGLSFKLFKEIKLESKVTEVVCKIKINCDKILGFDLAYFTC